VKAGRGMEPTEAGRVLTSLCRKINRDIEDAKHQIDDLAQLQAGHVHVGTGNSILTLFLIPVLKRFRSDHPQIPVRVSTGRADHVTAELKNRTIDLGIVFELRPGGGAPQGEGSYETLYHEEFVWAMQPGHRLSRHKVVPLQRITEFPLILHPLKSHVRSMVDRMFQERGLAPQILSELEDERSMETLLEVDGSIALLPHRHAERSGLAFVHSRDCPMVFAVGVVLPGRDYTPQAVRRFIEMCREEAAILRRP